MQTFLPYPSFRKSAHCLDCRRLGKQRLEAVQILTLLRNPVRRQHSRYRNHPAIRMWEGYEEALTQYIRAVILQWIDRDHENNMLIPDPLIDPLLPEWWGGPIHAAHRARLLAKDPGHYEQFGWTESPTLDSYWPVPTRRNPNPRRQ